MCSYGFDDYIYMAAVPFNNNDIFKKHLNSIAVIIDLNKTIAYYYLKCTQIKTDRPLFYEVIDYSVSVKVSL